jgi:hypothetical protein
MLQNIVSGLNDLERFGLFRGGGKSVEQYASYVRSSQKLDRSKRAFVDSNPAIMKLMLWEEFQLKSFVKIRDDRDAIIEGGMFAWDKAIESMLFFLREVYPGKESMVRRYVDEMHNLWSRLEYSMSWEGFVAMEENLRNECMSSFEEDWGTAANLTWSTTLVQYLSQYPRAGTGGGARVDHPPRKDQRDDHAAAQKRKASEMEQCFKYNSGKECTEQCKRIHSCLKCSKTSCMLIKCRENTKNLSVKEFTKGSDR